MATFCLLTIPYFYFGDFSVYTNRPYRAHSRPRTAFLLYMKKVAFYLFFSTPFRTFAWMLGRETRQALIKPT